MGGPGGLRCSASGCSNGKGYSLFRFPKDPRLLEKWLEAIGRPGWVPYPGARLCEAHFSPSQSDHCGKLIRDVVPLQYSPAVCHCPAHAQVHRDHPYARSSISEHCRVHGLKSPPRGRETVLKVLKENCSLQEEVKGLRTALNQKNQKILAGKENSTPGRRTFSSEDIKKGLQLRFACRSSGFKQVKALFEDVKLPSIRSLQAATQHIKFAPGILLEVIEALSAKMARFTDERDRDVTLVFDELSLKKKVEYDASLKRMLGYGTLTNHQNQVAEKAEIFVFRGVHQRLKQIVAYHLNPSVVDMVEKKKVIIDLLQHAADMNVNVIAIVCDMGNRALLRLLGYSTRKDSLNWWIPNPVKPSAKLWCVPDPVHIFKALKECLVSNRFLHLPQHIVERFELPSGTVDMAHVEWLEQFQRDDSLQMVPGLTFKHLRATHFSKMKVNSSHKIINPRVTASLRYLLLKGIVPIEYETTAWFLKLMNRWFQLTSSRNLQCALGLRNMEAYEEALSHLKLVIEVFESAQIPGGWKPVQSHIIFSTSSLLEIQEELLHNRNYQFVQTAAFSTDTVENINSCIRITNPNPTCLEFKNRLKHLVISQFQMKISSSSYDYDDTEDFVDILLRKDEPASSSQDQDIDFSTLKWSSSVPRQYFQDHQDDVLYRTCGYVIVSLKKKKMLKCEDCLQKLRHSGDIPHPNSLFLILTDFVPGAQFAVCDTIFVMFRLIEFHLLQWIDKIRYMECIDRIIELIILPGVAHVQLPTCHNVKAKLVKAFTLMRFKQIAARHLSPAEATTAHNLSSKSAGSSYLAQNYR